MIANKRLLYLFQSSPYGSLAAQEGLDALLAGSIFEQEISLLFCGDGVYQLCNRQYPSFTRSIQKQLQSLGMYDIENVYACGDSLARRGMQQQPLGIEVQKLDSAEITQLLRYQDHILTF